MKTPSRFALTLLALSRLPCALWADSPAGPAAAPAIPTIALKTVDLWDGPAPQAKGTAATDRPHLAILPAPKEKANGAAIIVCPGGGYYLRAMDHEGLQVAQWFNAQGVHAFVLSYRVKRAGYDAPQAWLDGTRALRWVRSHAAEFGIDPQRIGMIGFSAGAHLITHTAEVATPGDPQSADPIERVSSRPDFLIPVYGSPSTHAWEDGRQVSSVPDNYPPTLMILTATDMVNPAGCMGLLRTLREKQIETELHVFGGDGSHGRGMHTGDPDTGIWPQLARHWLQRNAFFTPLPRVEVTGTLTIDGAAPAMAWVTLLPVDNPNLPPASIYYNDSEPKTPINGHFHIAARYGPVPGKYRVEVRHLSLGLLDEPTLEGERLYTSLSPEQPGPIFVEIKPGKNELTLALKTH